MARELWIQYARPDEESDVVNTADSEDEARQDDWINPGCPWWCYELPDRGEEGNNGTRNKGQLEATSGPHYFNR